MKSRFSRQQNRTGEYPQVLHKVKNADRLISLHQTTCNESMARHIIERVRLEFNCVFLEKISISPRHRRGRAGSRVILLPSVPLQFSDSCVIGKLRIGLVLHELAHVIHWTRIRQRNNQDRKPHGREYCDILDMLIDWYIENINKDYEPLRLAAEVNDKISKMVTAMRACGMDETSIQIAIDKVRKA